MKLLRKGIYSSGGTIGCTGLGVLTNMVLARSLLPEGMGKYQLVLTFSGIAVALLSFGKGQANIFFLNKKKTLRSIVVMNSVWTSLAAAGLILPFSFFLLLLLPDYFGVYPEWVIVIVSIGVWALFFIILLKPILQADLRVREVVWVQFSGAAFLLAVIALFGSFKYLDVNTALVSVACSQLVSMIVLCGYIKKDIDFRLRFSRTLFLSTFRYGLKLHAANLFFLLNTSMGLLILRLILVDDFSQVGLYGRGLAICKLILLVPLALGPVLYAAWSGMSSGVKTSQIELAVRLHLLFAVFMTAIVELALPLLILLLYGADYLQAVNATRILVVSVLFKSVLNVFVSLFSSDGRAQFTAYFMGFSLMQVAILSCILIPYLGIMGAALAEAFTSFTVLLIAIYFAKRRYNLNVRNLVFITTKDIGYLVNILFPLKGGKRTLWDLKL